jgi:predicted RNA-binding protein with TRAM domain
MMFLSYSSRKGGSYEGRRGHGKGFKSYPVEVDKDYEVEITEMSSQGEGIAKVQGFVILVADAKLGDCVKVKIKRIGATTANAEIVK